MWPRRARALNGKPMRDALIIAIVAFGALGALRRPWIGVLLWTWLSIMNPHRYAYGITYDAPLAAIAAGSTMVGILLTTDKRNSPFKSSAVTMLLLFMVWMTVSWFFGLDREGDYVAWSKAMKVDLMVLVGLVVLHSKKQMLLFTWVAIGSLAVLGVKGGLFTVISGGSLRVWGPPGSFLEDNNEIGLAMSMTIPMLRFLQLQLHNRWGRLALTVTMLLCAIAALGTQSRGALLAVSAMTVVFWWRGNSRIVNGVLIGLVAVSMLAFMPDSWVQRMDTIDKYQEDGSAQGRLAAWSMAWNLAFDHPIGVGFNTVRQELFDRYSHNPNSGARAAHSIYFQVLGNHGFVGLILYLMTWIITWWQANWLRKQAVKIPQARWCADLGAMAQVSLVGYLVGGAFLSLSYFDLPYNIMMLVVLARAWVRTKAWEREPPPVPSVERTRGFFGVARRT